MIVTYSNEEISRILGDHATRILRESGSYDVSVRFSLVKIEGEAESRISAEVEFKKK